MSGPLRYFVFNKEQDFLRGYADNLRYTEQGLEIEPGAVSRGGLFYSRLLDSREKEASWHRITVNSESLGDASIRFSFYAAEERSIRDGETLRDLEDVIRDPDMSRKDKEAAFLPYKVKSLMNPADALLQEAKGRYLWFGLELYGQGGLSPKIRHMKVYLPGASWLDYLPEVYQADPAGKSFTERYLSIFQSLYEDLEREIDRTPRFFDPEVAEGEFLQWLAGWIDVDDPYIWEDEQLRYLIRNGMRIFKARGARKALAEIVELYLGEKPYIVEHFQLEGSESEAGRLLTAKLYGENSCYFTVIVSEETVPSPAEHKTLLRIIESMKPAHMEANVVVLKPYIFLDKYSYLGMNSVLGRYRAANLDGFSALAFTGIEHEDEGERQA